LLIAFDSFFLTARFRNVGIYEYTKNLLLEFQKTAKGSINIQCFASPTDSPDALRRKSSSGIQAVETKALDFPWLWRVGLVNHAAVRAGADLLFSPSPQIVPWGLLPVAVTIHDAIPSRLPPHLIEGRTTLLKMMTRVAAKRSDKILTDSEHSKQDLVQLYNLPPEKVSVVHLGYNRSTFNASPPDAAIQDRLLLSLGIRSPYILHHGLVQVRKNLARLIQAYKILLSRRPRFEFQLVLAGQFGFGSDQIRREADDLVNSGRIIFAGELGEQQLATVIKGASLCVIPSLYEGFCLPMVESMACGVPTIASNSSCLPEISGGVLRYFDPVSEEEMAATIEMVLDRPSLQSDLATHGLKRASQFSWSRCAQETLAVLTGVPAQREATRPSLSEIGV